MNRELKILFITSGFFFLAGGLFGPIYAVFVEQIGGDLLIAGTAFGAFSITTALFTFILSKWEDRVKHQEKLVVAGYFLSCIGFAGYLLIKQPFDLFIVQIIFGLGDAVTLPVWDSLYSKHLDKGRYASEWGSWEAMRSVIIAIAASLGGLLAGIYGFRFLFLLMLLLSLIGFFLSLSLILKQRRKK